MQVPSFKVVLMTSYHPLGIAGKVAGKSSNTQWAFPTAPDEIWRGPSPARPQQCVHNGCRCRQTLASSVPQRFHYRVPAFASLGVGLKFRRDRRGSPQVLQVYFAAMWYSLDVAPPSDCSSVIKPKIEHRPIFLPAIPLLVEPIGCWASTVARLQEARRHSQGLAELGYF